MVKTPVEISAITRTLNRLYPDHKVALDHRDPLELLVATILSAQCTDVRVNQVTRTLFKKYKKTADYLKVPQEELEEDIRPTGFFRNKARSIRGACEALQRDFKGKVPDTMEELVTLPGVGRKTANCVLGNAFNKAEGVVVDTHVLRLSKLVGLSGETDPVKVEQDLMGQVPKKDWIDFANLLIRHGRSVCIARRPGCPHCAIRQWCDFGKKQL
jgi:endonuclease-3